VGSRSRYLIHLDGTSPVDESLAGGKAAKLSRLAGEILQDARSLFGRTTERPGGSAGGCRACSRARRPTPGLAPDRQVSRPPIPARRDHCANTAGGLRILNAKAALRAENSEHLGRTQSSGDHQAMPQQRRHEMGAGGLCICPKCGGQVAHKQGVPCQDEQCPQCGARMLREGSYHHQLFQERQAQRDG